MEKAKLTKSRLEPHVFELFLNVSKLLSEQVDFLTKQLGSLDRSKFEADGLQGSIQAIFAPYQHADDTMLAIVANFSTFFMSFEADVTWLDEISEGFKMCLASFNALISCESNLYFDDPNEAPVKGTAAFKGITDYMRNFSYVLCHVAFRLIKTESTTDKVAKQELISGGYETKFIPLLQESTKLQIEGSFKITGDSQLR